MKAAPLSPETLKAIEDGVAAARIVPWAQLGREFAQHDWVSLSGDAVEGALTIAQPFLPQAGVARMVVHLAVSLAREGASEGPAAPITPQMITRGVLAAESVDWRGFYHALKDGNGLEAGAMTGEVLARLAAPFFPPATAAAYAFTALAVLGQFTHPAMPYHIPGYRWDPLQGFVMLRPGEAEEDPDANNPLASIADWLGD